MSSLEAGYESLRNGEAFIRLDRDIVSVSGPDAATFLQGQLSQDIVALEPGGGARSLLLEPAGKVVAWLRVVRDADDSFLLDVEAGFGETVIERLQRFKIRTKAEIGLVDGWVSAFEAPRPMRPPPVADPSAGTLAYQLDGATNYYLSRDRAFTVDGRTPQPPDGYEPWRIEMGVPRMGAEFVPGRTIPAEAGDFVVLSSVSFTKGCYTGQELVARVDSRGGNVPRHLRGLVIDGGPDDVPPAGFEIVVGDKVVGSVTSSAWSPGYDSPVALAYVARSVDFSQIERATQLPGEPPQAASVAAFLRAPGENSMRGADARILEVPMTAIPPSTPHVLRAFKFVDD